MKKLTFLVLFASSIFIALIVVSCHKDDVIDNEIAEKAAKTKPDRGKPEVGQPKEGNGIGDLNHGGIIFWISPDSKHGLVCALNDIVIEEGRGKNKSITRSWPWGCLGVKINGANGYTIGTGQQNTYDILNGGCNVEGTAAYLCEDYISNGYDDWFLPSYGELKELFNTIRKNTSYGNFTTGKYWSSTQVSGTKYDRERYGLLTVASMLSTAEDCMWDGNLVISTDELGYFFARGINFHTGSDMLDVPCPIWTTKSSTRRVRPIREFWVEE